MQKITTKQREVDFSTTPLPARVIDVGFDSNQPPRLVDTAGESGIYAALSYPWGGSRPERIKSNIPNLRKVLELIAIGKPFLAAMEMVRKLGIRYLWADFLCVIQDDEDELNTASELSDIYSSATITICDAGGGLPEYDANSAIVVQPFSIFLNWSQPTCASDYEKCLRTPSWSWVSRGWTHQELALCHDVLNLVIDPGQDVMETEHDNGEVSRPMDSSTSNQETERPDQEHYDEGSKPDAEIDYETFDEAVLKIEGGIQDVETRKFFQALASFTAAKELVSTFKVWSLRSWKLYSIVSANIASVYLMQDLPTIALGMIDAAFAFKEDAPGRGCNCCLEYISLYHLLCNAS